MISSKRSQLFLIGFSLAFPLGASVRVIDETAIPYTGFLRKAEFDQRFPGETLAKSDTVKSGWYVLYSQESLQYLFGPMSLQSTSQDYLDQLREIVKGAIAQRPEISDYTLQLLKTPFDINNLPDATESSKDEPDPEASKPMQTPPPSNGFWGMVKRLFGF
jgi:hypothetical protein